MYGFPWKKNGWNYPIKYWSLKETIVTDNDEMKQMIMIKKISDVMNKEEHLKMIDKKETIEHIAYSYDFDDEVIDIIQRLGYSEQVNLFYGDLNRKSFFIKDPNGKSIQFIKK